MSYKTYTSEFKAKVVIEVLQGDKSLSEIASEYNLNPNMVRNWKSEFLVVHRLRVGAWRSRHITHRPDGGFVQWRVYVGVGGCFTFHQ